MIERSSESSTELSPIDKSAAFRLALMAGSESTTTPSRSKTTAAGGLTLPDPGAMPPSSGFPRQGPHG